jgi:hypothetical protein
MLSLTFVQFLSANYYFCFISIFFVVYYFAQKKKIKADHFNDQYKLHTVFSGSTRKHESSITSLINSTSTNHIIKENTLQDLILEIL